MKKRLCRFASCLLACVLLAGGTAPSAAAANRFTDVPATHWAANEIEQCVELGLFGGITADQFGLGQPMTRCAFAVVLCRFFGWETETPARSTYSDVPADAWYAGAVEAAFSHGAFTSQSSLFRPRDPITREELAVALVRSLGCTQIAGLAGGLDSPFTDVTTNAGYITMAYDLGLTNGTSATTFSPRRIATREQTAVIFIRLYNKLHTTAPGRAGILSSTDGLAALDGYDAVIVKGAALSGSGVQVSSFAKQASVRNAVQAAGASALLYAEGDVSVLDTDPAAAAKALTNAVKSAGYDGVLLDIPASDAAHAAALTALAQALRAELGDKTLYVAAEAPVWQGVSPGGYDYAALAAAADRLVLRIAPRETVSGSVMSAPMEPLEEVYYALRTLRDVDGSKLSLLLTTTGSAWDGTARTGSLPAAKVEALQKDRAYASHYSARYACAYLSSGSTTVWYLDERAAAARTQLLRLFGANQVLLSDVSSVSPAFVQGLR